MLRLVLSFGIVLVAGLVMGYSMLKRTKKSEEWGCLTYVAFLAGVAFALLVLWPSPSNAVEWLMLVGAMVLCVSVISLAATGWRTLLAPYVKPSPVTNQRRRRSPTKEKELDEQYATETFEGAFSMNPLSLMESQFGVAGRTAGKTSDALDSCLASVLLGIGAALTYLGVLLSYVLGAFLMPRPTSPPKRAVRAGLSFLYAAVVFAGASWLLESI